MAKIDEMKEVAIQIEKLLRGNGQDAEVFHDDEFTMIELDNVTFRFDSDGNLKQTDIGL